jgi:NTE family protein
MQQQKKIAIACQGGGSQCAFVAGALRTIFERDVHHQHRIVGLSGTSGGALTAAVAWYGLLKQAQGDRTPIEERVLGLWRDLTAQTTTEKVVDGALLHLARLYERGYLPSYAISPSSPLFRASQFVLSLVIRRPAFTDLAALLERHIDFPALPSLITQDSPTLLLGAADVLEGTFKTFNSLRGEISLEALLASAAIPSLFPAIWVDGHAYWDGIFSSNPPVAALLRRQQVRELPEEIWVVQVNRPNIQAVPETPSAIGDRRNQLAGNLSLSHEIELISIMNMLMRNRALTEEFRTLYGLSATEQITVRSIGMSEQLQEGLDHPSKLSRQPGHINALLADGEAQASAFLERLDAGAPTDVLCEGQLRWQA